MRSNQFIKKIRVYALISFLLPLITINTCLLFFKLLGSIDPYPAYNWNEKKIEYTLNEFNLILKNHESQTLVNCPKYKYTEYLHTTDNQILEGTPENSKLINKIMTSNKIKSIMLIQGKIKNDRCVKNYRFTYLILNNFRALEKITMITIKENASGFPKIKNPYFYGDVSISRTARFFPATLIFKPLIILSAISLLLYWRNNLNLFKELENKNILIKFSKKFFYFGLFSCALLIMHAIFLGLDFDSQLFRKMRRLIIILFILFELLAQIFLTTNLFKFREELKKYIHPLILKIKIIFIAIIFFTTCIAFIILVFGDPSSIFKHTLEWNYFAFLLVYYLLSRLLWIKIKTPVHTPEGA